MYNRQINADLYNRIEEEFSEYEKELWLRSPEVILSQADEYIIKRDIVRYLLDNNLPTNKASAILLSKVLFKALSAVLFIQFSM